VTELLTQTTRKTGGKQEGISFENSF